MGLIIDDTIDNGKPFDWGKTSTDYAKFRDIYPELFYQKIIDRGMQRHFPEIPSWVNNIFEKDNSIIYDLTLPFTRESWHGRMKACRGIGASALDSSVIETWEKEHLEYLASVPESFDIPHFASILTLRKISQ